MTDRKNDTSGERRSFLRIIRIGLFYPLLSFAGLAVKPKQNDTSGERRSFLRIIGLGLFYPLLSFAGFTVKPKPRHITVAAPLPVSGFHAKQEFILFARGEQAWAVSRTCTHLGCRVNFLEDQQLIECPCHQSRFTEQGKRLRGPAEQDLPVYEVAVQKGVDGAVTGYVVTI